MPVPSDQIKPQHMWCIDTAVVTHGRFYLRHTQALDHNNRKEVQNNSRRLRAACRCQSDQGGSGRFSSYNSSAGMVLTVLSWPQVYFSWWHFSVMSLVCLLQIWVMTRVLGSNSLQCLVSDDRRALTAHTKKPPHLEYWASGRFSEQHRGLYKACGRFFQRWLQRGRHYGPEWTVYHL